MFEAEGLEMSVWGEAPPLGVSMSLGQRSVGSLIQGML